MQNTALTTDRSPVRSRSASIAAVASAMHLRDFELLHVRHVLVLLVARPIRGAAEVVERDA